MDRFTLMTGDRHVPGLVQRYLERALPSGPPARRGVEITQTGEMVMKPGGRAMPFTATEWFAVDRIGFQWRARFRIAPLASARVRDGYEDGEGILEVRGSWEYQFKNSPVRR